LRGPFGIVFFVARFVAALFGRSGFGIVHVQALTIY
jgi:hypothetical protein